MNTSLSCKSDCDAFEEESFEASFLLFYAGVFWQDKGSRVYITWTCWSNECHIPHRTKSTTKDCDWSSTVSIAIYRALLELSNPKSLLRLNWSSWQTCQKYSGCWLQMQDFEQEGQVQVSKPDLLSGVLSSIPCGHKKMPYSVKQLVP